MLMADVGGEGAAALVFEEERDAELGEGEVGDDHAGEDGEERSRQWLEAGRPKRTRRSRAHARAYAREGERAGREGKLARGL